MDSQGNLRCGPHGRAWCEECSEIFREHAKTRDALKKLCEVTEDATAAVNKFGHEARALKAQKHASEPWRDQRKPR